MTIYTSNYARQKDNPLAIAISREPPEWYEGEHFEQLAPTWELITAFRSGKIDEAQYAKQYLLQLKQRKIDPYIFAEFPDGTMLLCYESPNKFCHRHLLSMWVENKTGMVIPEWKNEEEQRQTDQDAIIQTLFDWD